MDITLPGGNGLNIIKNLKMNHSKAGIVIISAKNSLDDKIEGLDIGADDYLTKPFHLAELNARIKAVIRRRLFEGEADTEINEIKISPDKREIYINDRHVDSTKKEFDLLLYLVSNQNQVLTRETIAEHLWGSNIDLVDSFDFRNQKPFTPIKTNITEFNDLNTELEKMADKLTHDYYLLKEFSENASHEMQTPLAIIQLKLELLFQKKDLGEENLNLLQKAYQASDRLSRLHHSLNLLTRIENEEYKEISNIHLKSCLENQIEDVRDIIELKGLKLEVSLKSDPIVRANQYLIEILFSNLLSNAIKHNIEKGKIFIELNDHILNISNDGIEPVVPPEKLFDRFRKANPGSDSPGLGLSIARQISSFHGFTLQYNFEKNQHTVLLTF